MSIYLESQQRNISANVAMQNALNQKNPEQGKNADFTSTMISVFNFNVRNEIKQKAQACDNTSSEACFNKQNGQADVLKACGAINGKVAGLQSLIGWANEASQEMAATPGLSESALSTLKQNWSETSNLASSLINNSINYANEVLTKISQPQSNSSADLAAKTSSDAPVQTVVKATQDNLDNIATTTVGETNTEIVPIVQTQSTAVSAAKAPETAVKEQTKIPAAKTEIKDTEVAQATKLDIKT